MCRLSANLWRGVGGISYNQQYASKFDEVLAAMRYADDVDKHSDEKAVLSSMVMHNGQRLMVTCTSNEPTEAGLEALASKILGIIS